MAKSSGSTVLTTRELSRATLARQLLLERVEMPVLAAVERLVGLQGQDPKPPYFGLAARLADFDPMELSDLLENRQLVRMTAMRSTVHALTAADALVLRPLCQPVVSRELQVFRKRLEGVDLDELTAITRARCGAGPVPLKELGAALSERWPDHDPVALKAAARILLPLVQAPPRGLWGRGGQVALATVQHWLGAEPEAEPDVAAVALRYLAAFGPASVQDMQLWCGLTRLAGVFERMRLRLRSYRDERGVELFDLPDAELPDARAPAAPRFLGEYDNVLIGHKDRSRIIPEEIRRRDWEREYHFATFLVDGFVRGLWRITRTKGTATLHLETFTALTRDERAAVEREAAALLTLVAPKDAHDLVCSAAR